MAKDDSKDDSKQQGPTDTRPQAQEYDETKYGDPEKLDRAGLVAKLDELGVPYDASANDDLLRATLRRAPELVAEAEAREDAARVGTTQPPAE
jgi:hypothetical protein